MPDYMIILIILMLALIGSAICWMATDIMHMRREEKETEHWIEHGETSGAAPSRDRVIGDNHERNS